MTSWSWLRDLVGPHSRDSGMGLSPVREGYAPPSQDTFAAIEELSRVVRMNPDAVEIYLALGNLYRSQGEIERAVQIRTNLILRPNLEPEFKAKALYELGRDFKRAGFMDRARKALEEAASLAGNDPAIIECLARLAAETGDHKRAAELFHLLERAPAEAHHLVALAREAAERCESGTARKALSRALDVHPGSVEAWTEQVARAFLERSEKKLLQRLEDGIARVEPPLRFLLPETLYGLLQGRDPRAEAMGFTRQEMREFLCARDTLGKILDVFDADSPDLLLLHYGGLLLLGCGDAARAKLWFERALVLSPEFWSARLELLALSLAEQDVPPVLRTQLEYFIERAREVKRFVCRVCGLKRSAVFFVCPRCQSWHSIGFRLNLTE